MLAGEQGRGCPRSGTAGGREGLAVRPQLQWRVFCMSAAEDDNAKNKRLLVRTDLNRSIGVI